MIFKTERQSADDEINKIKTLVKSTSLNYTLNESPFNMTLKLKKSFIKDYSKGSVSASTPMTSIPVGFPQACSPNQISSQSLFANNNDSGFVETSDKAKNMKKDLAERDKKIITLEEKLNTRETHVYNLERKNKELQSHIKDQNAKIEANAVIFKNNQAAFAAAKEKDKEEIRAAKKDLKEAIAKIKEQDTKLSEMAAETAKRKIDEEVERKRRKRTEKKRFQKEKRRKAFEEAEKKKKKAEKKRLQKVKADKACRSNFEDHNDSQKDENDKINQGEESGETSDDEHDVENNEDNNESNPDENIEDDNESNSDENNDDNHSRTLLCPKCKQFLKCDEFDGDDCGGCAEETPHGMKKYSCRICDFTYNQCLECYDGMNYID